MTGVPTWHVAGDWFDNCSCAVACPCTFAEPPDNGYCESVLFWHIQRGHYGDVSLDGLSYPQLMNAPGCETGPGPQLVTWGKSTACSVDAFGYRFQWTTNSSKHIPFDWTGP
jgi:hypothetical protein